MDSLSATICPKCCGRFSGPSYRGGIDEHLLYVCTTCGYQEKRPTKDAKPVIPTEAAIAAAEELAKAIRETPNLNIQPGWANRCPGHMKIC